MTESLGHGSFGNRLLEQDTHLYSNRYQEHRMQLQEKLRTAEQREKLAFRIVVGALCIAVVTCFLAGARVFGSPDPGDLERGKATWLSVLIGVVYALSLATFWLGLASYYSRFRPATRKIADNLRDESISELREEIRQLRQQLNPSNVRPEP